MRGIKLQERLWIFDFDGTLSPLVPDREQAHIHPDCKELLWGLTARLKQKVAILSSRSLDDLLHRVRVPGIYLGGGSGIEWQMPDGQRVMAEGDWDVRLLRTREYVLPQLEKIALLPGIELEDKKWSVAIHTRNAQPEHKAELYARLVAWRSPDEVRIFSGPEVLDIQFIPEVDKAFGVRVLCNLLGFDPSEGGLVYAGDDENDAIAMRWVNYLGGTAIMVGNMFPVQGTLVVDGQIGLVNEIRRIATNSSISRP